MGREGDGIWAENNAEGDPTSRRDVMWVEIISEASPASCRDAMWVRGLFKGVREKYDSLQI